jgi:Fanconi-associated nuclease 1
MQQRIVMLSKSAKSEIPEFPLLVELASIVRERITGSLLRSETGKKSLFEGVDGDPCSVEELVLQHYAQIGGWSGVHSEGSIWRSLFVLLLWDLVYDSSVPFVFQQPCQTVPMDLYSPFFFLNRQEGIERFVNALRDGSLVAQEVLT